MRRLAVCSWSLSAHFPEQLIHKQHYYRPAAPFTNVLRRHHHIDIHARARSWFRVETVNRVDHEHKRQLHTIRSNFWDSFDRATDEFD